MKEKDLCCARFVGPSGNGRVWSEGFVATAGAAALPLSYTYMNVHCGNGLSPPTPHHASSFLRRSAGAGAALSSVSSSGQSGWAGQADKVDSGSR